MPSLPLPSRILIAAPMLLLPLLGCSKPETSGPAQAGFDAGARMATHLFNAMSPMTHRAPGLTGAALEDGRVSAGLIADGIHVDNPVLRIALRAKAGPGRMFLVSDAMSTVGGSDHFQLYGQDVWLKDGRLKPTWPKWAVCAANFSALLPLGGALALPSWSFSCPNAAPNNWLKRPPI